MSSYSRTRKAITRISLLDYWIVNREFFRKHKTISTWKDKYKKNRKKELKEIGRRLNAKKRYCDVIKKEHVWKLFYPYI